MSFILDALKKSEYKRRAQAGGESVTLYDVSEKKNRQAPTVGTITNDFFIAGDFFAARHAGVATPMECYAQPGTAITGGDRCADPCAAGAKCNR